MQALEQDGFEILPNAIDPSGVCSLVVAIESSQLHRSRAGMRNAMQIPAVRNTAFDRRIIGHARRILGEYAFPFRATLFDKSLRSNWLVVWHQDTALPVQHKLDVSGWGPWSVKDGVICAHAPASALQQILAIRLHLDDSTTHNGALRVLPGTHKVGVLTDEAIHLLAQEIASVECQVAAGGLLLMRPLLVHASSKAQTDRARRVLHIEYAAIRNFPGGLELPDRSTYAG